MDPEHTAKAILRCEHPKPESDSESADMKIIHHPDCIQSFSIKNFNCRIRSVFSLTLNLFVFYNHFYKILAVILPNYGL